MSASRSGRRSTSSGLTNSGTQIEDIGHTAGHPGREVAPGRPEDQHRAAGHVLAAVVADALDDRRRAGVAHAEALAGAAAQEDLAAGRAVADDIAGDDVVLGDERGRIAVGPDDDPAAGEALADVVVAVARQGEGDAGRQEGAERLAPEPVRVTSMVPSGSPRG
jgi:hypothetical protein